jgi:hypothetical protein
VTSARRTYRLRTLLVAAIALGTSACGAGFHAGTGQVQRDTNGSAGDSGNIAVRNLLLLQDSASPPVTSLIGGFANDSNQPDVLTAVTVSNAGAVTLPSPITIGSRSLVTPGTGGVPAINVPSAKFLPGSYATVTLTFQDSGQLSVPVLVMAPDGPSNGS